MARPRKPGQEQSSGSTTPGSTTTTADKTDKKTVNLGGKNETVKNRFFVMTQWRILFGCCCLAIASYFGYVGYLETRVNTPFDEHKMVERAGLDDLDRYWGSYRPGTYFGMKTRDPHSLVMGLMWFSLRGIRSGGDGIRHLCENGDDLDQYGWLKHDGKTFGTQKIDDHPFQLETSFVKFPGGKFGGDWTARITVTAEEEGEKTGPNETISLIWYTALDEKTGGVITANTQTKFTGVRGSTPGLGEFSLNFHKINGTIQHKSFLSTVSPNLRVLKQLIAEHLRLVTGKLGHRYIALPGDILTTNGGGGKMYSPNFIATMITGTPPFTVDIAYQSTDGIPLTKLDSTLGPPIGDHYTEILRQKEKEFVAKFEETFKLTEKGYSKKDIAFAEAAMSNMIGGIGYFYGSSRVQSVHTKEPVPYWKAPLYTAVPSRSFFPRGFLWDEGFHGLLISSWDVEIELDIMCHWFDLMNVEGWIPREQILGIEALAKVPEEFVTQRNTNANPPTFFLTLKRLLSRHSRELMTKGRLSTLEKLYPRLSAWFAWYNTTQKGEVPGTYRWRGRENYSPSELNPKTLTSGLDDYPRATHPTDDERHIDLRCWIAFAAGVMADLSHLLGRDDAKYWETYYYLSDNSLLNALHLSPYTDTYSDWGLHTDDVTLKRRSPTAEEKKARTFAIEPPPMIRFSLKKPDLRFVDTSFGYISLFPFLLEILSPDAPSLAKILSNIRSPDVLWTDYGIRSLSKESPFYMKRNTEHDPPYWRGQIWINLNYLTLKSLHHYASQPGPHSEEAKRIYVELRYNVVRNIIKQYRQTGYIFEQYSDVTGEGKGCKPFTGWSALVVLIMSEQY